jgi:hypothetical protein
MRLVIDRIENGIAVCESLDTDDNYEIAIAELPSGIKEGSVLVGKSGCYTIDVDFTMQRKVALEERLDRLFKKHT